jgi:hypothetical protein
VSEEDNYLERSVQELGPPLAEYSVSPRRFWTRLIMGILLLLYGVGANYYWWVVGPQKFDHLSFLLLFGPPGMGFSLLLLVLANRGLNILLYPTGILRVQGDQVESYTWTDVEELWLLADSAEIVIRTNDDDSLATAWLEVDVPSFQIWTASLTLKRNDEQQLKLSPTLANYGQLSTIVQQRLFDQQWPRVWQQFLAGEPLLFGGIVIDLTGIQHKKNKLLWTEQVNMSVSSKCLVLKREGAWTSWAKIELAQISNPHLLVALLREGWRLGKSSKKPALPDADEES